eukprot:scaffold823_cov397-Prasinococcus_capsulatus_cf.AAC.9
MVAWKASRSKPGRGMYTPTRENKRRSRSVSILLGTSLLKKDSKSLLFSFPAGLPRPRGEAEAHRVLARASESALRNSRRGSNCHGWLGGWASTAYAPANSPRACTLCLAFVLNATAVPRKARSLSLAESTREDSAL